MGYWIGKPYWGMGYATEAAQALIVYAFQKENFAFLTVGHFKENPASARVIAKLGFEPSGEVLRDCAARGNKARCLTYRLTRDGRSSIFGPTWRPPPFFGGERLGVKGTLRFKPLPKVERRPVCVDGAGVNTQSSGKLCIQGNGGNGCMGSARCRVSIQAALDGGDGGKGGDIIVECVANLNTLLDYRYKQHYKAKKGGHGMGQNRSGAGGADVVLRVPPGTQIFEEDGETVIADLTKPGDRVVLARGGNGGFGDTHFKSSTNQAPRRANPGQLGLEMTIWLQLKLIADAGLVGLPNAASLPPGSGKRGQAKDRRLSLHHAPSQSRGRAGGRQRLSLGGYPRADRGRP